jgi:leucyl-tRNA synthetase
MVSNGATEDEVKTMAQADPKIQAHLLGKSITRVIYVPNKLLNLVVS